MYRRRKKEKETLISSPIDFHAVAMKLKLQNISLFKLSNNFANEFASLHLFFLCDTPL